MRIQQAYDQWAAQYDTNLNKTRDLEAIALQDILEKILFTTCLEIGCGTGKNTEWLQTKASAITAVDFSEAMLAKAKEKITTPKVSFHKADIMLPWQFATEQYDLIVFSLILEHVQDLDFIFKEAAMACKQNAYVYIGELHPYKQYNGSRARFDTDDKTIILTCFTHSISEYTKAAKNNNFHIVDIQEFYDEGDKATIPRILSMVFKKDRVL
jgi:ubiquinone/menaquinone biosynthesis C-methylase UbiE